MLAFINRFCIFLGSLHLIFQLKESNFCRPNSCWLNCFCTNFIDILWNYFYRNWNQGAERCIWLKKSSNRFIIFNEHIWLHIRHTFFQKRKNEKVSFGYISSIIKRFFIHRCFVHDPFFFLLNCSYIFE